MKNVEAMTDWMKDGDAAGLTPLAVQSAGAAAMAASLGMATASYMTGAMFGVFQGMMEISMRSAGAMTPTAPTVKTVVRKTAAKAKQAIETGADVVPMEAAGKVEKTAEKAMDKAMDKAGDAGLATVAKIKSDATEAAAAAREVTDTAAAEAGKAASMPTTQLEPEDFRRPAEIARPETPDDLKLISGVGPKLEQVLNGLGVWTFDQISKWTAEEIAWVDDYLQFKGRIERDDWIRQASALAGSAAKT
ncbi:NADH-ubiquinone dehydrogenase [Pseudohoeflea suaedae]|uniref:NADH-ubiquinone dehydrogenase n=2 Tax=Pseudohoeflea suaedae TaxID=877384 RepID=A0A4V6PK30_9HYPH|nr:NADH-ubiquinone dehydrogenase [Pseudohoeflea suaedae]